MGLNCTKLNIFFLMTLSRTVSEEIPNWSSQDKAKIITMSQINTLNISATTTSKTTNGRTKRNRTNERKKENILTTTWAAGKPY